MKICVLNNHGRHLEMKHHDFIYLSTVTQFMLWNCLMLQIQFKDNITAIRYDMMVAYDGQKKSKENSKGCDFHRS